MQKKRRSRVFLTLILSFVILFSLGCLKPITDKTLEDAQRESDQLANADGDTDTNQAVDGQADADGDTTSTDADSTSKDQPEEPQVLSFAVKYENNKYSSLDDILQTFGIFESRPNIEFHVDDLGDNLYGDPNVVPGGYQPFADIIGWGHVFLEYPTEFSAPPPSDIWPPGYYDPHLNSWTVYPPNWQPYDGNQWYMTFIILDAEVPRTHDTLTGTYASVSVTDGNPDNDFVPLPQYSHDFNAGTDRWDTMWYVPGAEWTYIASGENFAEIPTSAFGFFYGNLVAWLYPAIEVDPAYFAWRGWGHWIGLNWNPDTSGADVIMGNSTLEPVRVLSTLPAGFFEDQEQPFSAFVGNYALCSQNTCNQDYEGEGVNMSFSCRCGGCTELDGCDCHLFKANIFRAQYARYESGVWEYVAGPEEKAKNEAEYRYNCFCVKTTE